MIKNVCKMDVEEKHLFRLPRLVDGYSHPKVLHLPIIDSIRVHHQCHCGNSTSKARTDKEQSQRNPFPWELGPRNILKLSTNLLVPDGLSICGFDEVDQWKVRPFRVCKVSRVMYGGMVIFRMCRENEGGGKGECWMLKIMVRVMSY